RISVIRRVPRVVPDSIEPPVWRYRKCAEPMPLAGINRVVIDLMRRAEGLPAVGAAREHHVGRASPGRLHTCQHINVVVSRAAGAINRQEGLSCKSARIYCPTKNQAAAEINRGNSVKSWCLPAKLRIA